MDEVKAKRRYKVLLRELERVRIRGTPDVELESEVQRLLQDWPSLAGVQQNLSAGTAAMLAFGESMSDAPAAAAAADAVGHGNEDVSAPLMSSPPLSMGDAVAESDPALRRTPAASGTAHGVLALLVWAADTWRSFQQPPLAPRWLSVLIMLVAVGSAILHRFVAAAAPCSSTGALVDPVGFACLAHVALVLWKRPQHVAAFLMRDLVPALAATFVLFALTVMALNMVTERRVRYFCS